MLAQGRSFLDVWGFLILGPLTSENLQSVLYCLRFDMAVSWSSHVPALTLAGHPLFKRLLLLGMRRGSQHRDRALRSGKPCRNRGTRSCALGSILHVDAEKSLDSSSYAFCWCKVFK